MAGWEKGLYQRGNVWYIDKIIGGRRIHESTGTTEKAKAQRKLTKLLEEDYDAREFGKRPERTFEQAAAHYLDVNHHKKSIHSDSHRLANLIAFPGLASTPLSKIHRGTFDDWVAHRLKEGKAAGTINHGLKVVRQILNQAARDWRDENGLTWIAVAPKIKLVPDKNKKPPHPLKWSEQRALFAELPSHLKRTALFAVNTGCRDNEICNLRWEWERPVPEMDTTVFVVPAEFVKNNQKRLVVLNSVALPVVEECRDEHETHVFTYRGNPIGRIMNSAWLRARKSVGLKDVRVHDLKCAIHTHPFNSLSFKST